MIDIHCHLLPECDDGAVSEAESLEMLRNAYLDGVRTIVATPHNERGGGENTRTEVLARTASLRQSAQAHVPGMEILPGCEILLRPGVFSRVQAGVLATLGDAGRYVLVEFPFTEFPDYLRDELNLFLKHGPTPIIAHPERCVGLQQNIPLLFQLAAQGCLFQITAASLSGGFGARVRKISHRFIALRLAHLIASDSHSPSKRPPLLSAAVKIAETILGNRPEAENMVCATPAAVLAGNRPDLPQPIPPARKKWFFSGS